MAAGRVGGLFEAAEAPVQVGEQRVGLGRSEVLQPREGGPGEAGRKAD